MNTQQFNAVSFFIEPGKEGAVVVFLAVDVWSRYVTVVSLKQRNIQTVGQALVKFINHVRDGTVEIAFDNEPVLVAGVAFCEAARAKTGYTTIATPKKMYVKRRTGVAERFVQTIRGLQKTLLCHIEAEIKATIPSGHVVVQWAAMHALWSLQQTQCAFDVDHSDTSSVFGRVAIQRQGCEFWADGVWFGPKGLRNTSLLGDAWCMVGQGHC